MTVVHLVICNDCGYPAYEIEHSGNMRKYYCKRCKLIFMKFDPKYTPPKK